MWMGRAVERLKALQVERVSKKPGLYNDGAGLCLRVTSPTARSWVHKVLEPIWSNKTETASRVRGRIEAILDWATVREFRRGDNPARWKGHLENLFPRRSKVQKVEHHPALPYGGMGAFMASLKAQE